MLMNVGRVGGVGRVGQTHSRSTGVALPPVEEVTTSNTATMSAGYFTYADTPSWDMPNSDWSMGFLMKCTSISTGAVQKFLLSTGVLGAVQTVSLFFNGATVGGGLAGRLEARVRGAGSVKTLYSDLPLHEDGLWRYVVIRRVSGVLQMVLCEINGDPVIQSVTQTLTEAVSPSGSPTLCHDQALATQRNFIGSFRRFFKCESAITLADIKDFASNTPLTSGREFSILTTFPSSTGTYADSSGNGNTATRSASGVATGTGTGPTFGSRIGLTEYETKQVYQRPLSGTRPVPVKGSWLGPESVIQARAIDYDTGAVLTNWTAVTASLRGAYAGDLQVPVHSNWLIIETRPQAYPQIVSRSYEKWGVGAVFIAAGQSQMQQMFITNVGQPVASDLTSRLDYNTSAGWGQPNGMGIRTMLNAIQPAYNCPVGAILAAVGGSGLVINEGTGRWLDQAGSIWSKLVTALPRFGNDFEAVLWNQGGSDARQNVSGASYTAGLDTLYDRFLALCGRSAANMPFIMTTLYRIENATIDLDSADAKYEAIRDVQQVWGASRSGAILSGATHDMAVPLDDGLHWGATEQQRHGRMLAQTLLNRIGIETYTAHGPQFTGVSRSGAVITFTVAQNGGTGLQTPSAGTPTGFEFSLSSGFGTLLPVTSIVLTNATTITASLAADPGATVHCRYAYGADPDKTRMVYDNRTIQGDTKGAALNSTTGTLVAA